MPITVDEKAPRYGLNADNFSKQHLRVASDVLAEVRDAEAMWPALHSAHEGFCVLLEEVEELKAHVFTNQKRRDLNEMRNEAIQVAAMAIRFVLDVCNEERGRR